MSKVLSDLYVNNIRAYYNILKWLTENDGQFPAPSADQTAEADISVLTSEVEEIL